MLRLYCRYFSIQLKSALEYKVSFLLTALGQFFVSFAGFLSVFFMFQQFHAVEGFTYQQVLLCFSVVLSAFSIAELFAAGFKGFSHVVSNGEFDRIMLRPAGTLFQTFASRIEFSSVGRLLQAAIILAYAVHASGIRWTLRGAFLLLFMILCGTFLFMGFYIIYAALCFYPFGLFPILSPAYPSGKKQPFTLCCLPCLMPCILRPLLPVLEGWGEQIYVGRFIKAGDFRLLSQLPKHLLIYAVRCLCPLPNEAFRLFIHFFRLPPVLHGLGIDVHIHHRAQQCGPDELDSHAHVADSHPASLIRKDIHDFQHFRRLFHDFHWHETGI